MTSSTESSRSTRERIPNKVQWALRDITDLCDEARPEWYAALGQAERDSNVAQVVYLARVRDILAKIERRASAALNGEYDGQ
jgi:hypothetical protein